MRSILFAAVLPVASLFAQETVPPPAPPVDKPVEKPGDKAPADAPKSPVPPKDLTGSVSGDQDAPRIPIRPSGVVAPKGVTYPQQYLYLVAEAMKSFKVRDFKGAISYADKADAILPSSIWTINVRGAVAIERLDFAEGKRLCMEALKLDPDFLPAKFNLCEIPFLQGDYASARMGWTVIYKSIPKEDPTTELLVYRIFLTHLLEKDMRQAKEWLEKIPFPSQTPAYQYAYAAWEHEAGQIDKWQSWLQSAEFIWPAVKRADFMDVLIQLKWISPDKLSNK
jgi:tetratricopeptide (TPR) repeat protein